MEQIELIPGNQFLYQGNVVRLKMLIDLHEVIVEYVLTNEKARIPIYALQHVGYDENQDTQQGQDDFVAISDLDWDKAQKKLAIILPILASRGNLALINSISEQHGVSVPTLYRWIRQYDDCGSVTGLVEKARGGKGVTRLKQDIELLIEKSIATNYMTNQRKRAVKVFLDVRMQCAALHLTPPGYNTIRRRIQKLPEFEVAHKRFGLKSAQEQFSPIKSKFPGADFPLSVVQIDHTLVDIVLVDEVYRKVVGRPHLTMAIDVYSRCVMGFYLSFDPPGAIGTGMCISHSILAKEVWLSKLNIQGEWPCWGSMKMLHLDNAREFHGNMLKKACQKYDIEQKWRPVKTPNWGGHIERLMGNFMDQVHNLKGTTFSNFHVKKDYDSEKNAVMTLSELERWISYLIVSVYHNSPHSALGKSPLERYKEGIFGSSQQPGTGLPKRFVDEKQVRLDFLPLEERTVQEYGVLMDHIYYYDDVLRQYINSVDSGSGKSKLKRKFIFRRDPRDLSCIYFLDPGSGQYHRISYRNKSLPSLSIWEHREVIKRLRDAGRENIDERAIFEGYENMRKIEMEAIEKTKKMSKNRNRIIQQTASKGHYYDSGEKIFLNTDLSLLKVEMPGKPIKTNILPFEGLDDE